MEVQVQILQMLRQPQQPPFASRVASTIRITHPAHRWPPNPASQSVIRPAVSPTAVP